MARQRPRYDYTLTQAFELVGLSLFAQEWSGQEFRATPRKSVENAPPDLSDNKIASEEYRRSAQTKDVLIAALAEGTIEAYGLGAFVIPCKYWSGANNFRYNIELNLGRLPRHFTSQRVQSLRVVRTSFDDWRRQLQPITPQAERRYVSRALCVEFLTEACADGISRFSKGDYYDQAWEIDSDLSRRMFNSVWEDVVPEAWKLPGRPKWSD